MARILLVEDDAPMMRIISMWLQRNNHQVTEACNGRRGQERLLAEQFDIMVSDINMPEMSGLELIDWLRNEHESSIPILLLSSRADQRAIAEKLESQGVTVFPKPFSPSRLVSEIEKRLSETPAAEASANE